MKRRSLHGMNGHATTELPFDCIMVLSLSLCTNRVGCLLPAPVGAASAGTPWVPPKHFHLFGQRTTSFRQIEEDVLAT